MAIAMMEQKSFLGSRLTGSRTAGVSSRPRVVTTQALFGKLKKADKKEVERFKKSETVKKGKLVPQDPKKLEQKPRIGAKLDAARNVRREGGFGAGEPYQKRKIGPKMEGTALSRAIDPLFFVIGLSGFTVVSVGYLLLTQ